MYENGIRLYDHPSVSRWIYCRWDGFVPQFVFHGSLRTLPLSGAVRSSSIHYFTERSRVEFFFHRIYLYLYYFVLLKPKRSTRFFGGPRSMRGHEARNWLVLFLPCSPQQKHSLAWQ